MTLTLNQQRALVRMLPAVKRSLLQKECRTCEMAGEGFFDILKSAGKFLVKNLGAVAKEIGPIVIKELVVPMLKKKAGLGLKLAGSGKSGNGLRLAGQRGSRRPPCASTKRGKAGRGLKPAGGGLSVAGRGKKGNPWLQHVARVKSKHAGMPFKDVLKLASKSWK